MIQHNFLEKQIFLVSTVQLHALNFIFVSNVNIHVLVLMCYFISSYVTVICFFVVDGRFLFKIWIILKTT